MKSILIAEGADLVAELFASLFARDGWTVTTCLDGQRAADALGGSASYDAVLVSNRLHNMGGVELITRIRALAHRQGVPIVMVTGTEECAVVADALAAGADDVLYKPTDVAILVDTVRRCVEGVGGAHRWGRSDERRPGAAPMSPPDPSLPETDARRCTSCRSPQVLPIGRVIAIAGMIKEKHWCEGCGTVFLFARKPIV